MFAACPKFLLAGVVACFALTLGGCNDDVKKKNASLVEENTRLRTENDNLGQQNQQLQAQYQQLQGELTARPAVNQGMDMGGGTDYQQPERAPRRTGGGGSAGTRLEVAGDVLFAAGSVEIKAAGKRELDGIARTIKSRYAGHDIRVEGYTDTDKPNKVAKIYPTNEALSKARAEAVKKYLVSKGVTSSRVETVGRGAANPRGTKEASRRVEIVIMAK
ncbi:MAG: OmpA family protein [Phycisphaerales bacterium]